MPRKLWVTIRHSLSLVWEHTEKDRFYCIALSPCNKYIAYGALSKTAVVVCSLPDNITQNCQQSNIDDLKRTYYLQCEVNRLEFFGENYLVAISADGCCVIYNLAASLPHLQIKFDGIGYGVAVCFEQNKVAVAHGSSVTIMGSGEYCYGPTHRPSFELAEKLLQHPQSLKIALKTFPTLSNIVNERNNSLLHSTVAKIKAPEKKEIAKILLHDGAPLGLFANMYGHSVIDCTLKRDAYDLSVLRMLLTSICTKRIINSPDSMLSLIKPPEVPSCIKLVNSTRKMQKLLCQNDETNDHGKVVSATLVQSEGDDAMSNMQDFNFVSSQKIDSTPRFLIDIGKYYNEMSVLERIGVQFPDALLKFLGSLTIEKAEERLLMGNTSHAPLVHAVHVGLNSRCPKDFWKKFIEESQKPLTSWWGIPIPRCEELSNSAPYIEVCAFRLPFPDFCGRAYKKPSRKQLQRTDCFGWFIKNSSAKSAYKELEETGCLCSNNQPYSEQQHSSPERLEKSRPLEVVVKAASFLKDYSVFKKPSIVHAMVKYKWSIIRRSFYKKFAFFLVYLVLACILGGYLAETAYEKDKDSYFYQFVNTSYVKIGLCGGISIFSLYYLVREIVQIRSCWETTFCSAIKEYFSDAWNVIDCLGFIGQILTVVCFLILKNAETAKVISAFSQLVLFWKLLFYLRAFRGWGQFVRLIQRTLMKMLPFMLILFVLIIGFAMASYTLLKTDHDGNLQEEFQYPWNSCVSVSLMIYGQFQMNDFFTTYWAAILFFELVMIICVVLLLNLLIAILSESYDEVKNAADEETMFELANIVIEVERENRNNVDLCPTYVHVLRPVNAENLEKPLQKMIQEFNALISEIDKCV